MSKLSPVWDECLKVLRNMKRKDPGCYFAQPVDPVALNIPDYLDIITKPMDFRTIEEKLQSGQYNTIDEFADDVNQIWENARKYNGPTHFVTTTGDTIAVHFKKQFELIKKKEAEELLKQQNKRVKTEKSGSQLPPIPAISSRPEKVKQEPKKKSERTTKKEKEEPKRDQTNHEMTADEKRRLCLLINKLPTSALQDVVQIIHNKQPEIFRGTSYDVEEVSVNVTHLENSTLRELEQLVQKQ